jgi:hypothetical protein
VAELDSWIGSDQGLHHLHQHGHDYDGSHGCGYGMYDVHVTMLMPAIIHKLSWLEYSIQLEKNPA